MISFLSHFLHRLNTIYILPKFYSFILIFITLINPIIDLTLQKKRHDWVMVRYVRLSVILLFGYVDFL